MIPEQPEAADSPEDAAPPRGGFFRAVGRLISFLIAIPLWLVVIGVGVALLASWLWPYDLRATSGFAQLIQMVGVGVRVFQFHLGLGLLAIALAALLIRRRRLVVIAAVLAATVLGAEAWRALPNVARPAGTGKTLRVATMNVYARNRDVETIEAEIRRINANVLVIEEYEEVYHGAMVERLLNRYPYQYTSQQEGVYGRAFLSDCRIESEPVAEGEDVYERARIVVEFDGAPLTIHGVHHRSPAGKDTVARNFRQTASLIDGLIHDPGAAIYLGDFNASTWTPQLSVLRSAGLREAFDDAGWGRGSTWPGAVTRYREWFAYIIPAGLGVRIDHVMLHGDLVAVHAGVGGDVGGDHRPVWADLRRVNGARADDDAQ